MRTPQPPTGGGGGGGGGGTSSRTHTILDAPSLPASAHFNGSQSIKQTRLSKASYTLSKFIGSPKTVAVFCWNAADWQNVSGSGDPFYTKLAFWDPTEPHWIELSPGVCRGIETLLYHRPQYPNAILANAVETVTHEMMHALGVHNEPQAEAKAECFGMQLSIIMAAILGVPPRTTASSRVSISRTT